MSNLLKNLVLSCVLSLLFSVVAMASYDSVVYPKDEVVKVGAQAVISVHISGDNGTPLANHALKLFSSSDDDQIQYFSSNKTNTNGEMNFIVSSPTKGVSTFTIYDATADTILKDRVRITFFDQASVLLGSVFANAGNSSGPIDGFVFSNLPTKINVAESVSFKLAAVDSAKEIVTNYVGTVNFSLVDGNSTYVNLPPNYTFTQQDLGEHTFSLGLTFSQPGSYKIVARDLTSTATFGEQTFVVVKDPTAGVSTNIEMLSPVAGTYSSGVQVITGKSIPGSKLRIFDNDVKLADIVVGLEGTFSFTTPILQDGTHKIYIAEVNDIGTVKSTTEVVEISIDSSAPDVLAVQIDPPGAIGAGSVVKVSITSKETLSSAVLTLLGNSYNLTGDGFGLYTTSFQAPSADGVYALNFTLVDQLGNEQKFESDVSLKVGGLLSSGVIGDVVNLSVTASDRRVSLKWDPPSVHINPIKNYRVFYGDSPNNLSAAVDTFTDSTTWYIPNLLNGKPYYFAVSAIDDKGNLSASMSNVASATPTSSVLNPLGEVPLGEFADDISDTGPEVVWILVFSVFGGLFYGYSIRGKRVI